MKTYEWILFDADETLFRFDAFRGLQLTFLNLGVEFTNEHYQEYQAVNKSLWIDYQNGDITAEQLQQQRFSTWADKLQMVPADLNTAFITAMAEICTPLEGAVSLLETLKGKSKLGIITNGFVALQQTRLERTGLRHFFDLLVVSEEVGVAKPHPDIFEHALKRMGNVARDQVLMVGDNPDSDILGGINSGLDTCWLNIDNRVAPENITPKFQVSSLKELEQMLSGKTLSINFSKI